MICAMNKLATVIFLSLLQLSISANANLSMNGQSYWLLAIAILVNCLVQKKFAAF